MRSLRYFKVHALFEMAYIVVSNGKKIFEKFYQCFKNEAKHLTTFEKGSVWNITTFISGLSCRNSVLEDTKE